MADEASVRIVAWPKEPAQLRHEFDPEQPVPLRLAFEDTPAQVLIGAREPIPLDMRLAARDDIPLCIKICEPICAQSEYTITLDIFDRPVALVTVRGRTTLAACDGR
jgi:hypothetical protein